MTSAFDDPRHVRVDALAFEAEVEDRAGRPDAARRLWSEAAELETEVALSVPLSKPKTRGAFSSSAVGLWRRSGDRERARDCLVLLRQDADALPSAERRVLDEGWEWASARARTKPGLAGARARLRAPYVIHVKDAA